MVTDPIADMLTRIRNGGKAGLPEVTMPTSKIKAAIAAVLKENGYVVDWRVEGDDKKQLIVVLKYQNGKPVIDGLKRISKPSCRVYVNTKEIPRVLDGLGIAILSTSQGIMSDRTARRENVGGEVLCYVW
ncbi:MAG: 30S ribosomal protein S8 [Kiritimatiellaeota bacterium]|nr:30S ribosomal protein S8 [Kiritimatiellota bacterium]